MKEIFYSVSFFFYIYIYTYLPHFHFAAPPAFIKKLPPYHGAVYNAQNVSIDCSVECVPLCNISWTKDEVPMDLTNNSHFYVSNTVHPPDPRTNDFQSIRSELIWNLTAWPNGQLDRFADNGKFTCESSGNGIGSGVKSTTHFHVECEYRLNVFFFFLSEG